QRVERSRPVVSDAGRMVYEFVLVCEQGGERSSVARSDRGVEARDARNRGVRWHPAADRARCQFGSSFLRRSDDKLVDARERLVLALGVELLAARHRAIASEDEQVTETSLESAAAGAVGAEVRPAYEERIGLQGEDVIGARGEVY